MAISLAGLGVCVGILILGFFMRQPLIGGLFLSLPFGSTAIATVGGSSPLVFALFAALLVGATGLRRSVTEEIIQIFRQTRDAAALAALVFFAIASAILFPRLFMGQTSVHVVVEGNVVEQPLEPTAGNLTQSAYLALGAAVFFSFCVLLQHGNKWNAVERGYFAFAAMHAALGVIDIGAKLAGAGDLLAFLRTANYGLLIDVMEQGYWRIAGAYPEASTFATYSVPCLAFTFTFWRMSGSAYALALTLILFPLLVFSTSATGYASIALLIVLFSASSLAEFVRGKPPVRDVYVLAFACLAVLGCLGAYLYDENWLRPFTAMVDSIVFGKAASSSGIERTYWNSTAMESFFETYGMGVGMGSSRASSWVVAVVSQLGIIGSLLMALLLLELMSKIKISDFNAPDRAKVILGESARAATIAWLIPLSISAGSADPGVIFFIGLATVISCRLRLSSRSLGRQA